MERTGFGDPARLLPLLWQPSTRVGRTGLTVEGIVEGAVALVREGGLADLSMRKLADRLGVGTMTLYAHIPGRAELLDLMVDNAHAATADSYAAHTTSSWREGITTIAETNWHLFETHPWLLDVDVSRPPLGPGTTEKYEIELRLLSSLKVGEVTMDTTLALVLEHVRSTARQALVGQREPHESEARWWATAGPLLNAYMNSEHYPYATRVGQAVGEAHGAASDARHAYEFGLDIITAGLDALSSDATENTET
ncbi:TetR/AcrR family transcriptional regulator [Nocardioides okcheonensis]|uniref:TetR/AcrR family transcriptional regulator n=1 Tax=Nocardioides okcheonensis TaxID=2894081 RepID=UPI001E5AD18D|nr:TetR/AcrR family transcriptional regulator [Nocardioides okcheonensis]UFN45162.1 TetR/AcrR family transcriptional regulator [Nocardioides okcheonensis]